MRRGLLLICFIVVSVIGTSHSEALISIDHVDGLNADGFITPGETIKFYFRLTLDYNEPKNIQFRNSFRVYSIDGADWTPFTAQNEMFFDLLTPHMNFKNIDSPLYSEDSLHISYHITNPFIREYAPHKFDFVAYSISTLISEVYVGKSICIDSISNVHPDSWLWSLTPKKTEIKPEWNGPFCYTIGEFCCIGKRGNADGSLIDPLDISDLTFIVEHIYFNGKAPDCFQEADVNKDQKINISDVMLIADYMFSQADFIIPDCQE